MKHWGLFIVIVVLLAVAGATVKLWLGPLLNFVGAKTDLIQGLADAMQLVIRMKISFVRIQ